MKQSDLYYEVHVTIEPVEQERYTLFKSLSSKQKFWCSEWMLKKEEGFNFFATTRGKDYTETYNRMVKLIIDLIQNGFKVMRYKIEDTVLDSKIDDKLNLISGYSEVVESFDRIPAEMPG